MLDGGRKHSVVWLQDVVYGFRVDMLRGTRGVLNARQVAVSDALAAGQHAVEQLRCSKEPNENLAADIRGEGARSIFVYQHAGPLCSAHCHVAAGDACLRTDCCFQPPPCDMHALAVEVGSICWPASMFIQLLTIGPV